MHDDECKKASDSKSNSKLPRNASESASASRVVYNTDIAIIGTMRERGVLERHPVFSEITGEGVRWPDGTTLEADVILWCTGFRSSLDHLAPLMLRGDDGGITMTGRLATQVEKDPRIHLVGYGPSVSTIGANRAGRAAVRELMEYLGIR